MIYKKYNKNEKIDIGDLISYRRIENEVTKAEDSHYIKPDLKVIGVCTKVEGDNITVKATGICDVNVKGLVCIGDRLSASSTSGKACAIKYGEDESNFNIRSIGKIIGLYNTYNKVKVLLDIE